MGWVNIRCKSWVRFGCNSTDIIVTGAGFAAKSYAPIGVTYYPYTFRDVDHLLKFFKSDVYKDLNKGYAEKTGHQILGSMYYGTRHTTANKLITKCADLKGLKMRVPDTPVYLAMPRACGANATPIPFAEVYLALQNGTVEAQENPLTTIEAKKFYEVQKNIILTGHIVEHLNIVVAGKLWKQLTDAEKKIMTDIAQEASEKASVDLVAREKQMVDFFKKKGLSVTDTDRNDFRESVLKSVKFEDFGYRKADWDLIQNIK
ncbi:ABC transporter substrate-binding protein [Limnohabitans sp. TS-CS-82]|nr:ABC transporter substrate-binding protein [Limnohabitans sp. TS-CS-82]